MKAIVLWEDSGPRPKEFGPGNLLTACVADELSVGFWELRGSGLVTSNPVNGNGNVLNRLGAWGLHGQSGEAVVAVLDDDKVRTLLALPTDACTATVIERCRSRSRGGDCRLVLLVRNMESVAAACAAELGAPAQGPKSPNHRDTLLNKIAHATDRAKRDGVRQAVPTFDRLVRLVASLVHAG